MSVAEITSGIELPRGVAPPRHIDHTTALLDRYARSWIDLQQTRKALTQRELPESIVADFERGETRLSALLSRTLRQHDLWPWLSQFPGLGGAHTALIIGRIGDPRRFPGQRCSEGHYLPPLYTDGAPCPIADFQRDIATDDGDGAEFPRTDAGSRAVDMNGVCPGVMLPPRETTGVRSLWHWAGLHADHTGRAPRKRKGVQCDWEPRVRASVMQPGGIAEQIVRQTVPHYNDVYRATKARLQLRVAENLIAADASRGDANTMGADRPCESDPVSGSYHQVTAAAGRVNDAGDGRALKQGEADRIARKVAAKAFLGDLLTEWKGLTA